ncbi:RiPP maturation radical SAM C-methyltransferase [Microvirga rosea]|uniref:RiPP maturation radical SAM C-methyltransferase n=1 Tax=Microvirga rosea TaxID=2715425 RepID=UPI001D09C731|nr:RiPP maturation radical SAM C-methyltransferase [Microvirga rosea]MCB8822131.1 RiPP maturation radical SAM C-methyltransferase [Microvirga rosea]
MTASTTDRIDPRVDVCLVNMPLSGVERPSIALGLLKSILAGAGISSKVLYPSLWFLEYIGIKGYRTLESIRPEEAVVDWLFGEVAFPDFRPDHDRFLSRLIERNPRRGRRAPDARQLLALRGQMTDFIDWTARKILALEPRIVGCTSTFQQHVASLALLRRIREIAPDVVTMIGGANCESVMGRTTHSQFPWVDFVVSGEADGFIAPLVDNILEQGRDLAPEEIPFGVFAPVHRTSGYPSASGGDGVPRAITDDIRSLPLPDYDDYFEELSQSLYASQIIPGLPMEFSRGCWWGAKSHCTFCGLNGGTMSYRSKPAETVVDDMVQLSERYQVRRIEAVDNILDMGYFDKVMPRLADEGHDFSIFFEVKSNMKKRQLETLAAAGVRWIQPGIESLDSRVLRLMRKGCTASQNLQLLKWSRQLGIRVSWSLLCGFPGEDDAWYAEMSEWIPLISHLQPGAAITLRFDRYSPYFTNPTSYNLQLTPSELYRYAYPLGDQELHDQVYFFENDSADAPGDTSHRPGLESARQAIGAWFSAWTRGGALPMLSMIDENNTLIVDDTRDCAVERQHHIVGLARTILKLADEALPEAQLRGRLIEMGCDDASIAQSVEELLTRRLMVRLDGRLVGLPLWRPHRLLPAPSAFPGGYFMPGEDAVEQLLAAI